MGVNYDPLELALCEFDSTFCRVEKGGGMDINISTKVLEFPHVVQYSIVDGQLVSLVIKKNFKNW
jgi:hypothetical protein